MRDSCRIDMSVGAEEVVALEIPVCVGGPLGGVCPRHLSSPRVVKTTLPSEA